MINITASAVKELREKTNLGIMDCKEALKETNGSLEDAIVYLRKKGMMTAQKKAGRSTKEGRLEILLSDDGQRAAFIEVNCETDFVAKNEKFQALTEELVQHLLQKAPETVEQFLKQPCVGDAAQTVDEVLKNQIATIGENLNIRRAHVITCSQGGSFFQAYVHAGSKLAVLVEGAVDNPASLNAAAAKVVLKDVAMHIAASAPRYIDQDEVPSDIIAAERDIYMSQLDNKKPENIREKIVQGKLSKFYGDTCLLKQAFVKDPGMTVQKYVDSQKNTVGACLSIIKFTRYQLGD